jgi:hypothetical protein
MGNGTDSPAAARLGPTLTRNDEMNLPIRTRVAAGEYPAEVSGDARALRNGVDRSQAQDCGGRNAEHAAFVAILALAAMVRLWGLGGQPVLFFDSGVLGSLARRHQSSALAGGLSLLTLAAVPRLVALDSAPSGMPAVLNAIGTNDAASSNGPVLAFYLGEDRTNARLRDAFVNVPADLPPLAAKYPLVAVDMQASVFAGELTNIYAQATPRLSIPNGNDAWYLADLLEHYGISWGEWTPLLAKWQANREDASQLRVYALPDLVRSGG